MIEHALALAAKGLPTFPVASGKKAPPLIENFSNSSSTNPKQLEAWFKTDSPPNIGIAMGKGVFAIDIDRRNGGFETFEELKSKGLKFPITLNQITPNGVHLIYRTNKPVKQGAHVLGKGIDVRSDGGYIIGVGSVVNGQIYQVNWEDIAEAPDELIVQIATRKKKSKETQLPPIKVNPELAQEAAVAYLTNSAPNAFEGAGGDLTTFKVAAKLRDFGVAEVEAWRLMAEHWNDRCQPPWQLDELQAKVSNAYRYSRDQQGNASPEVEFTPVEKSSDAKDKFSPIEKSLEAKIAGELLYSKFKDINKARKNSYLVKKLLGLRELILLYGPPGAGKSFLVLYIALCISRDIECFGNKVARALVLYFALEGGPAVADRILAYKKFHNLENEDIPFFAVTSPINLLNSTADTNKIIHLIQKLKTEYNIGNTLVIFDTLSRALSGGDENSSMDMGALVKSADAIRSKADAGVLFVHHSGKDAGKGLRGHSILGAAADSVIEVKDDMLLVKKQRQIAISPPLGFKLKQVDLGKDEDGDQVTSCVIEPRNLAAERDFARTVTGVARKALSTLESLISAEVDGATAILISDWRAAFFEEHYADNSHRKTRNSAFRRALTELQAHNRIETKGDEVCLPSILS